MEHLSITIICVPFSQNWYRFWSFRTGVLEKVFGPHPPSKPHRICINLKNNFLLKKTQISDLTQKNITPENYKPTFILQISIKSNMNVVLQRKPFAFELFFCLANAGVFIFSSKTHSIVPTSNLCWNVQRPKNQLNQ